MIYAVSVVVICRSIISWDAVLFVRHIVARHYIVVIYLSGNMCHSDMY